jgi:hypothetical protein
MGGMAGMDGVRMRVLVACEFSGRVTSAFRAFGHDAWSCDIRPTIYRNREDVPYHIQGDVRDTIEWGWDMMIAFPPCTYLTKANNMGGVARLESEGFLRRQTLAYQFILELWNAPIERIAIENPSGYLNNLWQRPSQVIQPWQFGDPYKKATCLWLKNLPLLIPTKRVQPIGSWVASGNSNSTGHRDPHTRSITFRGIARAMASQWGDVATLN